MNDFRNEAEDLLSRGTGLSNPDPDSNLQAFNKIMFRKEVTKLDEDRQNIRNIFNKQQNFFKDLKYKLNQDIYFKNFSNFSALRNKYSGIQC